MIRWLTAKLLGLTARAGEQMLDAEQCLAIPPRALASTVPQIAQRLGPGAPRGVIPAHPVATAAIDPSRMS